MKNLVAALTLRFMDRLSGPSRGAVRAVGMIERGQKMAAAASSQWSKGLDQLDSRLNRLASASLVTDGLGRAGEAMMRPLKAGVVASAEFNRGMTGIGITAQLTDAKLAPLRATIFSTANEIGALPSTVQATFGAVLAEGVYKTESELSRAGVAMAKFQRLQAVMGEPLSDAEAGSFSAAMGSSLKLRADQLDQANAMVNRSAQQGGVSGATLAKFLPSQTGALVGLNFANEKGLADLLTANQLAKRLAGSNDQAANNISNLMSKLASPEVLRNFSKIGIDMEKEIKAGVLRGVSPLQTVAEITGRQTKADQFRIGELFGDQQAKDGLMALVQNLDEFKAMSRELQSGDVLKGYFADLDRALQGPAASFDRYKSGIAVAGIATGTILAPAVGLAAGLLSKVANWMTEASESGSWLAKAAVWAFAGMAGLAVGAGMVGHAVVGVLGPLFIMKTLLGPSGLSGAAVKGMMGNVIAGFGRMRMAAIAFNLSMLANPVVLGVVAAVAAVALIAVVVRKYWQPIKAFFGGVGQALGEAFGPALSAIGGALRPLKPLWDAVAGAVGGFFGWIGRLMQPMQATKGQLDGAANAGRNFGRIFVTIFNLSPIGLFARGLMGAFRLIRGAMNWRPMETLRNAWSGAGRVLQGVWSALRATVSAGAAAAVEIVARYHPIAILVRNWGPITGWVGGLWSRLTSTVSRGAASAVGVIARFHPLAILTRNWGPITGWVGGLWSRLTSTVSAGAASAVGIVARYHPLAILVRNWGPITGWLGGLWARARGVITSGVQSAFASPLGFLAALPARFRNMGVQIIQGLARGITSGASAVVQAAVNAATSAAQGARRALGIRSPSRVFAQIGGFTMEGLAMGLNRNARQPLAALTALASAMAVTIPAEAAVAVRPAAAAPAAFNNSVAPTSSPVETLRMVLGSLEMARPASTADQAASGGASREVHHHHRYGDITIQMNGANVTARDVARELGRQQQAQRRGAIHDDGAA